nr:hypothetical protein [Tanacetum cinerariifolium]
MSLKGTMRLFGLDFKQEQGQDSGGRYGVLYEEVGGRKTRGGGGFGLGEKVGKGREWRERFMNYLEEQTDGEAIINSIQNGDQPLPVIAQVSLTGTAQNAHPTLKDPKFWTAK